MILFTKILSIFLAVLVISKSLHDYKKKQEALTTALFWSIAWIGIVYVTINPVIFYAFANSLSKENVGIGTFVGMAFIFLFFVTYRIYAKAHRLERNIKEIVMKVGIKDIHEEL